MEFYLAKSEKTLTDFQEVMVRTFDGLRTNQLRLSAKEIPCLLSLMNLYAKLCMRLKMNKLIIGFLGLSLSSLVFAQEITCLDKLLPFNRHSGLHQVTNDEWSDGKETLDSESAANALKFLTNSKLLCKTNEVTIKVQPICSATIADLPQSNTCFTFTNLGYFVISRDNARNINFIFSRDKRFQDKKP